MNAKRRAITCCAVLFFLNNIISLQAVTRYVDPEKVLTGSPPYLTWGSAAKYLQDAIDVSSAGDLIRVTNGRRRHSGHRHAGSCRQQTKTTV